MSGLKELLTKKPLLGTFVKIPSTEVVEMIAWAGFDFIVIDAEHAPLSYNDIKVLTSVAQPQGLKVVVRPWNFADDTLLHVLDLGVDGLQVPQVGTPLEAARIARGCKYPPAGVRGAAFTHRAARFGFCDVKDYMTRANEDTLIAVHIETREALEACAEIAATPGIDLLFIGPVDLSFSLGVDSDFVNGDLRNQFLRIVHAARDAAKLVGVAVADLRNLEFCLGCGVRYIVWGTDVGLFKNQLISVVETVGGILRGNA